MIRGYLSRYSWGYPAALVYMLQASEYDIREYFTWYRRVKDFAKVALRGKLKLTAKARLLLAAALLLMTGLWAFAALCVYVWLAGYSDTSWVFGLVTVILLPYIVAFGLAVPLLIGRAVIQRPREQAIIDRATANLAAHPAVKIIVAGSFGKTTFKETLATVLAGGKRVAATPGNYNTPLGIARFAESLKGDEEILIIEAGEYYPGDIQRVCEMVGPDMGVITGVNQQHQMRFKTIERAVSTIFELADYLSSRASVEGSSQTDSKDSSTSVGMTMKLWVNGESELAAGRGRGRLYTRKGTGKWKVTKAATGLDGTSFTAKRGKTTIKAKSQLMGLHQVGPLTAVIDIAAELGLTPKQIEAGIAKTVPFKHRMNPSETNGVVTIDDTYNGNPDGFKAAIEFLGGLKGHRRVYVTPGIVELGDQTADVHRAIGRQLAGSGIEIVVLIKNSATPYIEEGLKDGNYPGQLIWQPDIMAALTALPQLTVKGDVVYLQNDWNDNYA